MTAVAAATTHSMSAIRASQLMEVAIKGRIDASRVFDGVRYSRIITPAPDHYSKPQTLEIRSKKSLGSRGEEIFIKARLGGFVKRPFEVVDKESGEVTKVLPVVMILDAVEDE